MKSLGIVGLGYIGLPTAGTFAQVGVNVLGFDVSEKIVETINSGNIHIVEEGLGSLISNAVKNGNLRAYTEMQSCDVYIIAVPTPIHPDKTPDLNALRSATEAVASVLKPGQLIIVESTIPPRTCVDVVSPIVKAATGLSDSDGDYLLAHCPERVLPGRILYELIHNDRIIGGTTPQATEAAAQLYSIFVKGQILKTDATTAETCKLLENTFRDVNIALANEMASICHQFGIQPDKAIELANRHPRVNIHAYGIGVGGHCIPVDPWFIVNAAPEKANLIRTARMINDRRPHAVKDQIVQKAGESKKPIALLGLAFKPDVDDLRESPATEIAALVCQELGTEVLIVEPHTQTLPTELSSSSKARLVLMDEALERADQFFVLVKHQAFSALASRLEPHQQLVDAAKLF